MSTFSMTILLILQAISAVCLTVISLLPIYMRLLRHVPALLRLCQGVTSGLMLTMVIFCVWLHVAKIPCQIILSLALYLMTSSLTWFVLDNIDVVMSVQGRNVASWRYFGIIMSLGWGIGLFPVVLVLAIASSDMNPEANICWFGERSHWAMAAVLFVAGVVELITLNLAVAALLQKRRADPQLKGLSAKKSRLMTSALTFTAWTVVNCVCCLALSSGRDVLVYLYGAMVILFTMLHGGLFVLGEYKVHNRLSVVYRLLKLQNKESREYLCPEAIERDPGSSMLLTGYTNTPNTCSPLTHSMQPVPPARKSGDSNSRPGSSQSVGDQQPREVCRVPPLSKEGPKLGAVYRRRDSDRHFEDKM